MRKLILPVLAVAALALSVAPAFAGCASHVVSKPDPVTTADAGKPMTPIAKPASGS